MCSVPVWCLAVLGFSKYFHPGLQGERPLVTASEASSISEACLSSMKLLGRDLWAASGYSRTLDKWGEGFDYRRF